MLILFAWLSPVGLAASSRCWQFPFKYRSRLAWHQPVCFCFNCCISGVFSKKSLCVPVSGRLSQCFPLVVCWYQVMDRGLWSISDWFLYKMGVLLMVLHTQGPFYQHCLLKRLSFSPGFVSAGCRYVGLFLDFVFWWASWLFVPAPGHLVTAALYNVLKSDMMLLAFHFWFWLFEVCVFPSEFEPHAF